MAARREVTGDCFQASGMWLLECAQAGLTDATLVHGEVRGQGPVEGLRFGHAWLEVGDHVFDVSNGRTVVLPRMLYYRVGGIGDNLHRYTLREMQSRIRKYGHWGPWDLETASGL